jgi:hypothetical protein
LNALRMDVEDALELACGNRCRVLGIETGAIEIDAATVDERRIEIIGVFDVYR